MKSKYEKIILLPPCHTYGDCLSVVSMIYFFLDYYDIVYFYINDFSIKNYYVCYFQWDPNFNKRIFITDNPETLINDSKFGEYHICNTYTGDWKSNKEEFKNLDKIDKEFYFNESNPVYNKIKIDEKYCTNPNLTLPNKSTETNHIFYYKLVGLNNIVRMNFFNYYRNLEYEKIVKESILNDFGIAPEQKYNIINDPVGVGSIISENNYQTINISNLSSCPGNLLYLIEGAEIICLVEGSNVNFLYHCQYKKIFKYEGQINFFIKFRNRMWDDKNMNLDWAWKMMDSPKLDNWNFIF